ncbi:glycosyltransferase family 2 protein [Candidatus Pelagibacter sp.]|nr:glycosyltransferase family 2 protein [Candidatus Pelagibacter sp.]
MNVIKKKVKISVLIRSFNEGKWIKICLKRIQQQTIKPLEVIILDNNSLDGTIDLAKNTLKNVKFFPYTKKYIPGKMLNYGISKCKGEFILILSAHCIPKDNNLIRYLIDPLLENNKICASYGRQIPLNFSDDLAIRDLILTYGAESRIQKKDAQFNNACSLIRKIEWEKTNFDNKISNLEDRYWASKKIKQKKLIFYSADAKVFHYHGSHHNNDLNRLQNTKKMILRNKNSFSFNNDNLNLKKKDIFPIYIHSYIGKEKLLKNLKKINSIFQEKTLVLTKDINLKNTSNFKLILRKKNEIDNDNYYLGDVLNYYKKQILDNSKNKEYLLIFSDNFSNISNNYLKKVIETINNHFPDTIYSVKKTLEPIFYEDNESIIRLNKLNASRKNNKGLFIANRDHGIAIHTSRLYEKDKFSGIIKLIIN